MAELKDRYSFEYAAVDLALQVTIRIDKKIWKKWLNNFSFESRNMESKRKTLLWSGKCLVDNSRSGRQPNQQQTIATGTVCQIGPNGAKMK